jgi:hypothetical protein
MILIMYPRDNAEEFSDDEGDVSDEGDMVYESAFWVSELQRDDAGYILNGELALTIVSMSLAMSWWVRTMP